ncbi:MAG: RagB/SusD family nutrient uptake outer membrane protein [Bacteroidales bacterium]|nr:RagB/SusD family nutrient uptake outer membrane protein [Bacteroidales bacterium]
MKKIKLISAISCVILLFACEDNLNFPPQSVVSSNSMWKIPGDAQGAMFGMLSQFRSAMSKDYIRWGDYRSGFFGDGIHSQIAYQDLFNNVVDDTERGSDWKALYTAINDCNLIIKYVPEIEFTIQEDKDFILANAYFIRALTYFYITRIWGDVPLLLSGFESDKQENLYPTRTPVSEILAQVASDIDQAVSLFPDDDAGSRKTGSKAAANMLKADYYLWMAKMQGGGNDAFQKANTAVDYVLANTGYELLGNYETVFRNDDNNEIIFALDFEINEYEGGFSTDWLVAVQWINDKSLVENTIATGSHAQWVCFTPAYEAFLYEDSLDTRAKVSIDTYDEVGNRLFRWINKYRGDWVNETRFFTSDIKIYRLAEAILFKAEIENELGNQASSLVEVNKIAKRAYGQDDYYAGTYTKEELDAIILDERLKEFSAEGKSWWDMIRFGVVFNRVVSLIGRESEPGILLWPVHVNAINTNPNITQTNGY